MKATNEYMQYLLARGGEGETLCDKGCKLHINTLKEQVKLLSTEMSSFKVYLNRLMAIMTRINHKLDDVSNCGN